MKVTAWIALGSNLGERRATLDAAVDALRDSQGVEVHEVSDWIETEPVGGPAGQGPFLNGVLRCETTLSPRELLTLLQAIEERFGRERTVANGPRTLDLDLLTYEDRELEEPDLVLPHPRLAERVFVLEPLRQLDPDWRIPRTNQRVSERLQELRAER